MDDRKIEELLEQLSNLTDVTRRQVDLQEKNLDDLKKQRDKEKLEKDKSYDSEVKRNKNIADEYRKRLGTEELTNKNLKKTLDERQEIEKKVVEREKKRLGEEAFNDLQRNRAFRDQMAKYSEATQEYGGVVKSFQDFSKLQQIQIAGAYKQQKLLEKQREDGQKLLEAMADPRKAFKEAAEQNTTLSKSANALFQEFTKNKEITAGANIGMEAFSAAIAVTENVLKGLVNTSLTMSKSILSGERGLSVGAKGISEFTKSLASAVEALSGAAIGIGTAMILLAPLTGGLSALAGGSLIAAGAVGKLGAGAAKLAAEFNEMAANLNDKLYQGFKELGKLSITGARGITGVIENLHKMGLTVNEMDKFTKVIGNSSKEMKMFGATAEDGVNKFATVAGNLVTSDLGKALDLMGISAEEQYEHTEKYLALQARLGILQEKNAKDSAVSVKNYIEEMDKITELTGATRREQEEARDQILKVQELRAAILTEKDPAKQAQLKAYEELSTFLQAQGFTASGGRLAKLGGAGGIATDAGTAEIATILGPVIDAIKSGKPYDINQLKMQAGNLLVGRAKESGFRIYSGAGAEGYSSENLAAIGDYAARTSDYNAALEKARKEQGSKFDEQKFYQEYIKSLNTSRTATDKGTVDNVNAARDLRNAAISLENIVKNYNDAFGIAANTEAINKFKDGAEKFAEYAKKLLHEKDSTNAPSNPAKVRSGVNTSTNTGIGQSDQYAKDMDLAVSKEYRNWRTKKATESGIKPSSIDIYDKNYGIDAYRKEMSSTNGTNAIGTTNKSSTTGTVNIPAAGIGKGTISGLLDFIGKYESGNDYNVLVGNKKANLTDMTIEQVLKFQSKMIDNKFASTAVGKYQIVKDTLSGLVDQGVASLTDKFDKSTQDKLAIALLKERGLDKYLSKKITADQFADNLTPVWAALPLGNGKSHAEGIGWNKALVGRQEFLENLPQAKTGGLLSGPDSGYPVALHGGELVSPLEPNSILEKLATTSAEQVKETIGNNNNNSGIDLTELLAVNKALVDIIESKLDNVISVLESSNDTQEKILRYSIT